MIDFNRDEAGEYELQAKDDDELCILQRALRASLEIPRKSSISPEAQAAIGRIIAHKSFKDPIPLGDDPEHLRVLSLLVFTSSQHPDDPSSDEVGPITDKISAEYVVSTTPIPDEIPDGL
ncbi:MAG TPA: hypothetical protein VK983_04175 [Candidatus Limnocylindrales bacterium]|nr:hypothetical protein [Candidatus Limnocylindrales bacterium]